MLKVNNYAVIQCVCETIDKKIYKYLGLLLSIA